MSTLLKVFLIIAALVVGLRLCQWVYTEWWVSQHCTMILGTQVCR